MIKKLLTLLVVVCMLLVYMPMTAFATSDDSAAETQTEMSDKVDGVEIILEGEMDPEPEPSVENTSKPETEITVDLSAESESSDSAKPALKLKKSEKAEVSADGTTPVDFDDYPHHDYTLKELSLLEEGEDENVGEHQTEDLDFISNPIPVHFVIDGASSINFGYPSGNGSLTADSWFSVNSGDTLTWDNGTGIVIQGISGMYISAARGDTLAEAQACDFPDYSRNAGESVSLGIEGESECYVYIKVSSALSGVQVDTGDFTPESTGKAQPSVKVGDGGSGYAKATSTWPIMSGGHASGKVKFKITSGWLKANTKIRSVTATCVSGSAYALPGEGSKYKYKAKVTKVSGTKITVKITFYPYKCNYDSSNLSHGKGYQVFAVTTNGTKQQEVIKIKIKKYSAWTHYSHPENYSLAGAQYEVFTNAACTTHAKVFDNKAGKETNTNAVFVTDANGDSDFICLKKGNYWIKEKASSQSFALAPGFYIDEQIDDANRTGSFEDGAAETIPSTDIPITGYLTLVKEAAKTETDFLKEAPNNYTLGGAVFEIYTDAACTKRAKDLNGNDITLTTNKNGATASVQVDIGDYFAKEVIAPKGYLMNNSVKQVTVALDGSNTMSNPATFNFTDDPTYGEPEIKLIKFDSKGVKDWSRLTGAYYQLSYYDITCWYKGGEYPTVEDLDPAAITYGTPTRKWIFKTRKFNTDDPAVAQAGWDWQTDDVVASVRLDSPVTTAGGIKYKAGDTITSDPFYMENGKRILPIGFYTIEEIKAPVGVSRNDLVVHGKIYQPAMGQKALDYKDNNIIRVDYDEIPQTVTIAIQKVDAETGENKPQGASTKLPEAMLLVENIALKALYPDNIELDTRLASFGSLAGAVYNVYFDNDEVRIPEIVGQIVTDENGYGELTKRTLGRFKDRGNDLEPGNYYIEEVSASPGYVIDKYVLDGTNTVEVSDHEIEVVVDYTVDGEPVTKKIGGMFSSEELTGKVNYTGDEDNEVAVNGKIDSRHMFQGRVEERNTYLFKFTTTSKDMPHNTEISKTDITTGKELPGALLQVINSDGEIVENWISTEETHIIKALPSGTYTLREITAPYGYDIAEDVQFTIVDDVIYNKVEMKNKPLTVGTQAMDAATKAHQGTFATDEIITDTVKVTGLYTGRTYKISGVLMDKLTGEAVKDAEGNAVTAESEPFVATADEMEIPVNFTVNSSEFTTDSITVVFEKLYRTERIEGRDETNDFPGNEFPVELQKHEDIDDEEQTIHYGGIVCTTALDKASQSQNILADKEVTIVDTVEYKNLAPASEYVVKGELYDKTTGQLLGVTGETTFTPETPDGTVEVEFTFDASALMNHDIVVFEELYINGVFINDHKNPDDEAQTIHVPEIHTTATDSETMAHVAYAGEDVTIIDTVEYKNLLPGKEYVMNGVLMNKETGEPLLADGEEVRASTTFTPTEKDGFVDVVFTFNGVDLAGTTTVAFEDCTINGVAVAVHADLEDEAQTVDIPYIGTQAALVKKSVEDTVEYTNLAPGKYVMRGWLVNHKNGKKLIDSDGETEFEITEPHASGEVIVDLPIKGYKKLGGYSLTAFEELYYVAEIVEADGTVTEQEVLVADHKDKDDKDQTVKIPGVKTGDTNKLYIFGGLFAVLVLVGGVYCFIRRRK